MLELFGARIASLSARSTELWSNAWFWSYTLTDRRALTIVEKSVEVLVCIMRFVRFVLWLLTAGIVGSGGGGCFFETAEAKVRTKSAAGRAMRLSVCLSESGVLLVENFFDS